jgi:hypothetical protein
MGFCPGWVNRVEEAQPKIRTGNRQNLRRVGRKNELVFIENQTVKGKKIKYLIPLMKNKV